MKAVGRNLLLFLGMAAFPLLVSANWNDTSTGIDLNKLPRFPMTKVHPGGLPRGTQARFDGIRASGEPDGLGVVLRGADRGGRPWIVFVHALGEVWKGDLDGNGRANYVLASSGPYYNGRTTPLFSLSILLMDEQGRPVPYFAPVYHGGDGLLIKHLADLDGDGRAELLVSSYDEKVSDPLAGTFSSGHWVTQVYRFRNCRAEEVQGEIGERRYPYIHKWSYHHPGEPPDGPEMPVQQATVREHGTPVAGEEKTLLARRDANGTLRVAAETGCRTFHPETVVYDRPTGRSVAFPAMYADTFQFSLEEQIRRASAPVRLIGINRFGHGFCQVNLLWAGR